jgi:hypothetical protein
MASRAGWIDAGRWVIGALLLLLALPSTALASSPLTWSTPQLVDPPLLFASPDIVGISCPSPSLCAAIDTNGDGGHILTSANPVGGAATWSIANLGEFDDPRAVSCPTVSFCAVADNRGNVWISSEPTGGIAAWAKTDLEAEAVEHESSLGFVDVSCPTASFCAVIDDLGNVFMSTDPTGGMEAWTETALGDTSFEAIACTSPSLCAITDFAGNVVTSADPTGGSAAWHSAHIDGDGLGGVACPSPSLCVIGGFFGDVFSSLDPTLGAGTWVGVHADGLGYLLSVACPSVSFCVAVDSFDGNVVTSIDPTGSASAWSVEHLNEPEALLAVSCASPSLCVAGGNGGNVVVGRLSGEGEGGGESEGEGGESANPPSTPAPSQSPAATSGPLSASPKPVIHKKRLKCRKGFRKRRVHGKARCVRVAQHRYQAAHVSVDAGLDQQCMATALARPQLLHTITMHHAGVRPLTPHHWHSQGTAGWFQLPALPEGCTPAVIRAVAGQIQMQKRTDRHVWINVGANNGNLNWKGPEFVMLYAGPNHAWPDYVFNECTGGQGWLKVRGILIVKAKDASTREVLSESRYIFPAVVHGSCQLARTSKRETAHYKEEWGDSGSGTFGRLVGPPGKH